MLVSLTGYVHNSFKTHLSIHGFQVDGFLARRYNMRSVLGTILDPAADKALMSTLVITLGVKGLLPCTLMPLESVHILLTTA